MGELDFGNVQFSEIGAVLFAEFRGILQQFISASFSAGLWKALCFLPS